MKQKSDKREKELDEFKQKTSNQADLHKELLEMDKNIKVKKQMTQGSQSQDLFDENDLNESDHKEVDRRLQIYKNMRKEIMIEESKTKNDNHKHKMSELDVKIKNLEKIQKEREDKQQEDENQERTRQQQREAGNKNFLGNIKSYSIDDI